ncbi:MAG: TIGR04282 family arsenosugar biosynthesis glycosyltransferase [Gammaproteobacteria bacterium]|nr:TIGR04282 family arsenosugar biosynthesis glycosyltransferase [Gammaproteobacteria bacterium]
MNRSEVLLLFAKAPLPGQAKTRLIPALGAEGAAALQQRLLRRSLLMASGCGADLQLWCSPDTDHSAFVEARQAHELVCHAQRGKDLGQRMAHAMDQALRQYRKAVLIGTDCPGLSVADVRQAFDLLQDHAAVIGPAADGGYYLIGLHHFEASLFQGIDWGSERVLDQSCQRLRQAGMDYGTLTTRRDLDRPEDLTWFPELLDD